MLVDCDDPAEKAEYWKIIETNNDLLLRLINDILDLSKIESGIIERRPEKFNLARICNEVYTMVQPKVTNPEVKFFMDTSRPDCWVFLDSNRLKQVWMNFLTNAVKCTKSGYVKMGYTVEREGIRIYVEDTGTGIPKELQHQVFGRFQKLNDFAQGTGLGLAISKAITEAAGGEIGFTSEPGVGSLFWAYIPCKIDIGSYADYSDPAQSPTLKGTEGKEIRILVAEDNDSNYSLVQHILKGYDLIRAENGVEAIEKIRNGQGYNRDFGVEVPDFPGGFQTAHNRHFHIHENEVELSANAFDSDRICAIEAGCNAFLAKPVKKRQLLDLVTAQW